MEAEQGAEVAAYGHRAVLSYRAVLLLGKRRAPPLALALAVRDGAVPEWVH